ncbi:MAG: hypothetical protein GF316_14910 [Candidatus Lokiarchaeota archaeon]|nr:hypothetical protein [Candidatus Lokiarchaeota archaeon]
MVSKIKQYCKFGIILVLITLSIIPSGLVIQVAAQSEEQELVFEFSDSVVTRTFSVYKDYDMDTFVNKKVGTYKSSYIANEDHYWGTDGLYHVKTVKKNTTVYCNNTYKRTVVGHFKMKAIFEMYEVQIHFSDSFSLFCYALKEGDFYVEYFQDYENEYTKINQTIHRGEIHNIRKYSDESQTALISEVNHYEDIIHYRRDYVWNGEDQANLFINYTSKFSAPLLLIFQSFTATSGERIAWGEQIWDMIMYNDTNQDGFYSADSHFYLNNEYRGYILPFVGNSLYFWNHEEGNPDLFNMTFPNDLSIEDIQSQLDFTKPTLSNGHLTWKFNYNNFPSMRLKNPANISAGFPDLSYSQAPKANFSYEFDFSMPKNQSKLEFTSGVSTFKTPDNSFYQSVQDYELCIPHYTYMLSSVPLTEEFPSAITAGSDHFAFETESQKDICQLDMRNEKKPYILSNYSNANTEDTYTSIGAGMSQTISSTVETVSMPMSASGLTPFVNLIFSLEDMVALDPIIGSTTQRNRLFSIETKNYPVWSGNGIYHDPIFRTYFDHSLNQIGMLNVFGLVGGALLGIIISTYLYRKHKRRSEP